MWKFQLFQHSLNGSVGDQDNSDNVDNEVVFSSQVQHSLQRIHGPNQ